MSDARCSLAECDKPLKNCGYCAGHYYRLRRYGDPRSSATRQAPHDRFYSHVDKSGPVPEHSPDLGPCWLWTGTIIKRGYGRVRIDGWMTLAHRWAWVDENGPIPEGLEIDHLCRVTSCVRPSHLDPVTPAENMRRRGAATTHCRYGHLYTEETTGIGTLGTRFCRICSRETKRRYEKRRRQT